ncbi:MAG: hypothetical protein IPN29_08825 [Saprospiraceae bacterium]|nr:hypothetical protein [Saprospiraceae bacterium]
MNYKPLSGKNINEIGVCFSIMEDSHGAIWFSSSKGLNRYDGNRIITYAYNPADTNSIHHNFIYDILEYKQKLYLATWGKSNIINKIDINDGSISRLRFNTNKNGASSTVTILGKEVLLFTGGLGVFHYDLSGQSSYFIDLPYCKLTGITKDSFVYLRSDGKNHAFKYKNKLLTPHSSNIPDAAIQVVYIQDKLFFSTANGLISSDPQWVIPQQLRRLNITCLFLDKQNKLWLGTEDQGLFVWDIGPNVVKSVKSADQKPLKKSIRDITEVKNNLIYIASFEGIFTVDNSVMKIKTITTPNGLNPYAWAMPIKEFSADSIFLTFKEGFYIYTPKNIKNANEIIYTHSPAAAIHKADQKSFYAPTLDRGTLLFHKKGDRFQVEKEFSPPFYPSLASVNHRSVLKDHAGNLWFGTYDKGLYTIDREGRLTVIPKNKISGYAINSIFEARNKEIWITFFDKGMVKYKPNEKEPFSFEQYNPDNGKLCQATISGICEDSKGKLWLSAYGSGIIHFDPVDEHMSCYSSLDGLSSNNVYHIVADKKDNIWCPTSDGVSVMLSGSKTFRTFKQEDGLPSNDLTFEGSALLSSGEIILGTKAGYCIFHPDTLLTPAKNYSHPFISDIKLLNKSIEIKKGNMLSLYPELTKFLTLAFDQDHLTFEFGNRDSKNPDKTAYQYKLEGFDKSWIDNGTSNLATYTRIPPGTYTLRVKASTDSGYSYHEMKHPLILTILPPWYQTLWFRLLILGVSVSLIWYLFNLRTRFLMEKQRVDIEKKLAISMERKRIARDMHDDLGSGMSAIHLYSDYLKKSLSVKYPEISSEIDRIVQTSADLNQKIKEIIWSNEGEASSVSSILLFLKKAFKEKIELKNMVLHIDEIDKNNDIILRPEQTKNVYLTLKEATNNTIKHANASIITITFHRSENELELTLRDNGSGFDAENIMTAGSGLKNMEYRMKDIGGQAIITSGNDGTAVILRFST